MKRIAPLILTILFCSILTAQLTVTPGLTESEFSTWAQGPGVLISNVTLSGDSIQFGTFSNLNNELSMVEGLVLSSGKVTNAVGPNDSQGTSHAIGGLGDFDMTTIISVLTQDAAIIEFDFIPSFDTFEYNYSFASEEYPEFVNSSFNDGFGFFVSGPGITGPYMLGADNFCLVPGSTDAVAINSVNNGTAETGPCMNCAYYNSVMASDTNALQVDGITSNLVGSVTVTPNMVYHAKIVVVDAGDQILDSWLFIEKESIKSYTSVNSVQENGIEHVTFATNPMNELLSISDIDPNVTSLVLSDMNGQEVLTEQISSSSIERAVQDIESGVYIIQYIYADGHTAIQRIVKE